MNEIILESKYKLAIRRAMAGITTGQDVKAIVAYQMRDCIEEGRRQFTDGELAILTLYMIDFN
jgi:hypothetical protein